MTNRPMPNKVLTPVGAAEAEYAKPSTKRGRTVEEPFNWIPPSVLRSLGQRVAKLEMTLSGNIKGHGKQSTKRQPKQTKKNFKQQKRQQNIKNATINKAAAAAGTTVIIAAVPSAHSFSCPRVFGFFDHYPACVPCLQGCPERVGRHVCFRPMALFMSGYVRSPVRPQDCVSFSAIAQFAMFTLLLVLCRRRLLCVLRWATLTEIVQPHLVHRYCC